MANEISFQVRMQPETNDKVLAAMKLDNCKTKNEFFNKALLFYCGHVLADASADVLPATLVAALDGAIQCSEERVNGLLFKLAVEVSKMTHVLAAAIDADPEQIVAVHDMCVREVKQTNGSVSFRDAVEYQESE